MLIQFSVGNFLSFKEIQTFSMETTSVKSPKDFGWLDTDNLFQATEKLSLLKSAAIYGANASGKSNFVKAISWMSNFVLHSHSENIEGKIAINPFLFNTETIKTPSFFEIVFLVGKIQYRYGFELTKNEVEREWLYRKISRETLLFSRVKQQFNIKSNFQEGNSRKKNSRENALFLSTCAQNAGTLSRQIMKWFHQILHIVSGLHEIGYINVTYNILQDNPNLSQKIHTMLNLFDNNIGKIIINQEEEIIKKLESETSLPDAIKNDILSKTTVYSEHKVYNNNFEYEKTIPTPFEIESDGTKKFLWLTGPILDTLEKGGVLFVDELDNRLHPVITRSIIQMFNDPDSNPNNAQLIFVTHDSNLLSNSLFRRDQIWFTEKDQYGGTNLYSLAEFKVDKVRYTDNFEKNYLAGKYGAIPFFGSFDFPCE